MSSTFHSQLANQIAPKLQSVQTLASLFGPAGSKSAIASVDDCKSIVAEAKKNATAAVHAIVTDATAAGKTPDWSIAADIDAVRTMFELEAVKLSLCKNTHPSKDVCDAAAAGSVELSAFATDAFDLNVDLFKKMMSLEDTVVPELKSKKESGGDAVAATRLYFFEEEKKSGLRRGLGLDEEGRAKVAAIKKRLSELSTTFEKNVNNYKKEMPFTADELKGLPQPVLDSLKKDEESGKFIATLDYPCVFPIFKFCSVAATRKQVFHEFERRAFPENMPILAEILKLRQELATLLSFKDYAALDLDSKMAKTPEAASAFVDGMIPRLQEKWDREHAELCKHLPEGVTLDSSGAIEASDITYVMECYKRDFLKVDESKLSEYFSAEEVFKITIATYERFYSCCIKHVTKTEGLFWHETVTVLEVYDKDAEGGQGPLRGYVVCDLEPRENKYGHACCYSYLPGVKLPDGSFTPAVTVLLCNFPRPGKDGKPALFQHNDAVTFLHELGHAFHSLMGKTHMPSQGGTRVKRDYVELPSQSVEQFYWHPAVLAKMTHWESKAPLDQELLKAKIKAKHFFSGRDMLRQMTFAKYALEVHSAGFAQKAAAGETDTTVLYDDIRKAVLPHIVYSPETRFECAFSHLLGYGASYYGYAWADSMSFDVFDWIERNCKDGELTDPAMGARYCKYIVGPGGSQDPDEILTQFLGRKTNSDAYFKQIGI